MVLFLPPELCFPNISSIYLWHPTPVVYKPVVHDSYFPQKKKPKDKAIVKEDAAVEGRDVDSSGANTQANGADENAVMTYKNMLDRAYRAIKENNPDITEKKRYVLAPPQIMRVGTTRTCWSNFADICKG